MPSIIIGDDRIEHFKYRQILTSEIIHVGRPIGRGLDCLFHVNPQTNPMGLVIVFNPTERRIEQSIRLPLYYTGLDRSARVSECEAAPVEYTLDRPYIIPISVSMEPDGYTWFLVE